ncbi:tetratricopeptide repeat protein, partial [Nonomuraea sp. NPDC050691]|uniref:tetratricopeptide repeat protein n=1 Tax=Nonomuraea sp. NPDC050691 TaxID=3155661 RepID=UPI0033FFF579
MAVVAAGLPCTLRDQLTALLERGRYREAERAGDAHLDQVRDPAALATRCLDVAALWRDKGAPHRGLRYAETALATAPGDARAHAVRLSCLPPEHRLYEAIEAAREAVTRCPDEPGLWLTLAELLTGAGLRLEALDAATRGLGREPDHEGLRLHRGAALLALGRDEEAGAAFAGLPAPEVTAAYLRLNMAEEAVAVLDPGDPEHVPSLLECLVGAGRRPEACAAARAADRGHAGAQTAVA